LDINLFSYQRAIEIMVKIRTSEAFIRDTFWNEKIFSFLHLSLGQEASAVGVALALNEEDLMLGNHRFDEINLASEFSFSNYTPNLIFDEYLK
jgi:TPP-dependent pyruvate/acetoin dehydrogenase alpha subunit